MLRNAMWTLAHEGGWDELLMFGVPVVLAVVAVRWAERRAKARAGDAADAADPDQPTADEQEGSAH